MIFISSSGKYAINLDWEGPYWLEDVIEHHGAIFTGVYGIIRLWPNKDDELAYIGMVARRPILERFKKHVKNKNTAKRGRHLVIFAPVNNRNVPRCDLNAIISDIETLLIYKLQPRCNEKPATPKIEMCDLRFGIATNRTHRSRV